MEKEIKRYAKKIAKVQRDKRKGKNKGKCYIETFSEGIPDDIGKVGLKEARHPDLLINLTKEISKKVVGEQNNTMTLLLISIGGLFTTNAHPTSKNLAVNDESGAGKDFIANNVFDILPSEQVIRRKRLTPTVFTYWHNALFEPDWTWDNKICYVEDVTYDLLNSDVFKVMSSSEGNNISTITINQKAVDIQTIGKPVMIITYAEVSPKLENLRRYPSIRLDITPKQTENILDHQIKQAISGNKINYDNQLKASINHLKSHKVKLPEICKSIPRFIDNEQLIWRTKFPNFLDYIKFSAVIHQHNREVDDQGFLIANMEEDYQYARICFMKSCTNALGIPLSKNQEKILKIMKNLPEQEVHLEDTITCAAANRKLYTVNELEPKIPFYSNVQIRRELGKLQNLGFLNSETTYKPDSKIRPIAFEYVDVEELKLPTWEELTTKLTKQ